jgi:site-specific recombinase XerD
MVKVTDRAHAVLGAYCRERGIPIGKQASEWIEQAVLRARAEESAAAKECGSAVHRPRE